MKDYCFVIQPFDKGKFDKRYRDVFKPAIEAVDVVAYRVDEDYTVDIPIDAIEEKISDSRFCLADITTDNPNVWYEVGYAIAINKDVILLCSKERTSKYPFDIQHRNIISYSCESSSDFADLKNTIIKKVKAILSKPMPYSSAVSVNMSVSGLDFKEITFLGAILKNQGSPNESVSAWSIKNDMKKSGLNEIAFNLSSRKLIAKKLIDFDIDCDVNGEEYSSFRLTGEGDNWVLENEDKFVFTVEKAHQNPRDIDLNDDDLPF